MPSDLMQSLRDAKFVYNECLIRVYKSPYHRRRKQMKTTILDGMGAAERALLIAENRGLVTTLARKTGMSRAAISRALKGQSKLESEKAVDIVCEVIRPLVAQLRAVECRAIIPTITAAERSLLIAENRGIITKIAAKVRKPVSEVSDILRGKRRCSDLGVVAKVCDEISPLLADIRKRKKAKERAVAQKVAEGKLAEKREQVRAADRERKRRAAQAKRAAIAAPEPTPEQASAA